MSDTYQAIYDAVRYKIGSCDMNHAVESALREANFSFYFENAMEGIKRVAELHGEPSAIYRPTLSIDGNKWCALYGEDLQNGVAGFGDSPAAAMADFNSNWHAKLNK